MFLMNYSAFDPNQFAVLLATLLFFCHKQTSYGVEQDVQYCLFSFDGRVLCQHLSIAVLFNAGDLKTRFLVFYGNPSKKIAVFLWRTTSDFTTFFACILNI